jgi:hypothetical protein
VRGVNYFCRSADLIVAAQDTSCVGIRAALRALAGPTIDLEWAGGSATLVRANQLVR